MENNLFRSIKTLANDIWGYKFISVLSFMVTLILLCILIINLTSFSLRIEMIEKQIKSLEQDNKDLNFEIGKAQGIIIKNGN